MNENILPNALFLSVLALPVLAVLLFRIGYTRQKPVSRSPKENKKDSSMLSNLEKYLERHAKPEPPVFDGKKAAVFVVGPSYYGMTTSVFKDNGKYTIADRLDDADIVVFTGGEDINPVLYGEQPLACTYYNSKRDKYELEVIDKALAAGKFLVGICRGAQLLNCVPNGGKLWQDVNGHTSKTHSSFDCISGTWVPLNSVHHQMMKPTEKGTILCWAIESTTKKSASQAWTRPPVSNRPIAERDKDAEVVWYEDTRSLLFQAHPEFGHPPTTKYFFSLIDKLYWGL